MKKFLFKILKRVFKLFRFLPIVIFQMFKSNIFILNRNESYRNYILKQKEKTLDPKRIKIWKNEEWDSKIYGFTKVFEKTNFRFSGKNVLCVGSRVGQEVVALKSLGASAVGIDLVSFPPFTLSCDLHNLCFKNKCMDFIFTNVFDHIFDPIKFASEVTRVLKPNGIFLLRIQLGIFGDAYTKNVVLSHSSVKKLFYNLELKNVEKLENEFDGMSKQLTFVKPLS